MNLKYCKRAVLRGFSLSIFTFLSPGEADTGDIVKKINPKSRQEVVDKSYGVGDVNGDGVADERDYFDIPPEFFEKSLSKISTGCIAPPEYCDAILNPYFQPNDSTFDYLGSGDARRDDVLDSLDLIAMQSGEESDEADVDGDGIPSTTQDQQELSDRLDGTRQYLRGEWNPLGSGLERDYWNDATLEIDLRDTLTWTFPTLISKHFAGLGYFFGFSYHDTSDTNMYEVYREHLSSFGRYNFPMYFVSVVDPNTGLGHGMNAFLRGEDSSNANYSPLRFEDWNFVEPQNDSTHVERGTWNIPFGTLVSIYGVEGFRESKELDLFPIVLFELDSVGNATEYYHDRDLIIERPTISVSTEEPAELLSGYKLSQNYPNPFNPETTIKYGLPKKSNITLIIYSLMGREIIRWDEQNIHAGLYEKVWDGRNKYGEPVASGIYFYKLRAGEFTETRKMVLLR